MHGETGDVDLWWRIEQNILACACEAAWLCGHRKVSNCVSPDASNFYRNQLHIGADIRQAKMASDDSMHWHLQSCELAVRDADSFGT